MILILKRKSEGKSMKGKNETILVLGNGFDIAHGLPTSYIDFIRFELTIQEILNCHSDSSIDVILENSNVCNGVKKVIKGYTTNVSKTRTQIGNLYMQRDMWKELLVNNYWLRHFENCKTIGEGWIDFESEMEEVLCKIDTIAKSNEYDKVINPAILIEGDLEDVVLYMNSLKEHVVIKRILEILKLDLDKVRRALEIYLSDYVESIPITNKVGIFDYVKPTKVISFNYTKTYEKTYGQDLDDVDYTYIHGTADSRRDASCNDMVLGVDEYLADQERNTNLLCVDFKKYYQRLAYRCSRNAEIWANSLLIDDEAVDAAREFIFNDSINLEMIDHHGAVGVNEYKDLYLNRQRKFDEETGKNEIIIFGHSLGVSDKDILRMLVLHSNVHTTIYYHSIDAYRSMIKNMIKVIGYDEIITRTGNKNIEFMPIS